MILTAVLGATLAVTAPESIAVEEHLGARVPQDLELEDSTGQRRRLADYFDGKRPVLLVLSYYHCPMLCGLVLEGAARAVRELGFSAGEDYRVVTLSFDPNDGPFEARQKQHSVVDGAKVEPERWPFLVARSDISGLLRTLGFTAIRDPASGEFAHPAVVFVLSPDGRVSRYLYGIDYHAADLKLALLEASAGRVGTTLDRVLMRCYAYDPARRRYALVIANVFRAGGVVIFGLVAGLVLRMARRERRA